MNNLYSSTVWSWQFTLLLIIISVFLIFPVWQSGVIVGGDWVFPYSKEQLYEFYTRTESIWHFREIPTGSQLIHNNIYPFELIAGFFYFIGSDGIVFQKVLLCFIIFSMGCTSFYAFNKITNNRFASLVASIAYLFSPIFFNYMSMGWIFVLFFLAVLPLIFLLIDSYFKSGDLLSLILLGVISSVSFAQSQAIIWIPLIIFIFVISLWICSIYPPKYILHKYFMLQASLILIIFITHMFWIIPSMSGLADHIGTKNISSYDSSRFNVLNSINLIRGWGGVANKHFETIFNSKFLLFSFFSPIVLCILLLNNINSKKYLIFSVLLVILPFILFLGESVIVTIPYTNIIRDFNRFIVLSNFGYALAIALLFSNLNSISFNAVGLICLLLSIHPFLGRTLFTWSDSQQMNTSLRFLSLPDNETEKRIDKFAGQKNLLFPTGAHIGTLNDPRFKKSFAEMADLDATFSQNASGIYVSDKSTSLITNFADQYLHSAIYDQDMFLTLSRIYGVDNILIRKGLFSSYDRNINSTIFDELGCQSIPGEVTSDWSISKVCHILNSYPIIYSPERIINSNGNSMINIVRSQNLTENNDLLAIIGCPQIVSFYDRKICTSHEELNFKPPVINFYKIDENKYRVIVTKIKGNYMLVLNQTLSDGWRIRNANTGEPLGFKKILVNHLVNGWVVITSNDEYDQEFILEFAPKWSGSWLRYISFFFLSLLVAMIVLLKLKDWKKKT